MDAVLDFVSEHREWVFLVTFVLAFAETLLVISVFVPSTALLLGLGGLVAAGSLDYLPLVAGAALGATSGSLVSWGFGRIYGPRLLRTGPMRRHAAGLRPARRALRRWGPPAVIAGHLIGPLRSVVFVFAGLSAMPFARFFPLTVIGASVWALVTPFAGEIVTRLMTAVL